jgi:hypothetical protein
MVVLFSEGSILSHTHSIPQLRVGGPHQLQGVQEHSNLFAPIGSEKPGFFLKFLSWGIVWNHILQVS